ncbi:MAG: hypothetical protein Q8O24_00240 [Gallionellaceae bacterium]|nr:hypothetical protein [Gallionellaceae bacterium]
MEISSGNSGVQIAIAVQPQNQMPRQNEAESDWATASAAVEAPPMPSVNTSGQEVGSILNTWA